VDVTLDHGDTSGGVVEDAGGDRRALRVGGEVEAGVVVGGAIVVGGGEIINAKRRIETFFAPEEATQEVVAEGIGGQIRSYNPMGISACSRFGKSPSMKGTA
jgi:hypothetical protein